MYFELSLFFLSDWHIFLFLVISINQTKKFMLGIRENLFSSGIRKIDLSQDSLKTSHIISCNFDDSHLESLILF